MKKSWHKGTITEVTRCWIDFQTQSGSKITFLFSRKNMSLQQSKIFISLKEKQAHILILGQDTQDIGIYIYIGAKGGYGELRRQKRIRRNLKLKSEIEQSNRNKNLVNPKATVLNSRRLNRGGNGAHTPSNVESIVDRIRVNEGIVLKQPKCPRKKKIDPQLQHKKLSNSAKEGWKKRRLAKILREKVHDEMDQ